MTSDSRPRRTTRVPAKGPVELTSSVPQTSPNDKVATSSNGGTRTNGKRRAEDEDKQFGMGSLGEIEGNSNPSTRQGARREGKNRVTKSNKTDEKIYDIDFILTNRKSPLVEMDISDVLNNDSWISLSPESRGNLCKLLPATAFGEQAQKLDSSHPARRPVYQERPDTREDRAVPKECYVKADEVVPSAKADESSSLEEKLLDPSFFRDPHFESAARTFQDHLYSGWFTPNHRELIDKHVAGIRDGVLHAPWKDDIWDQDHPEVNEVVLGANDGNPDHNGSIEVRCQGHQRKESKTSEFHPLVQRGFLKLGDIITLKHKFSNIGTTVEKDALITAIHPKTSILTLTVSSGTVQQLPPGLLIPNTDGAVNSSSLREMTVSSPMQLITALLDIDGRIPRGQRPRLDTWKLLTVWQWPLDSDISEEEAILLERGGRVSLGTLFYLRGQALDD